MHWHVILRFKIQTMMCQIPLLTGEIICSYHLLQCLPNDLGLLTLSLGFVKQTFQDTLIVVIPLSNHLIWLWTLPWIITLLFKLLSCGLINQKLGNWQINLENLTTSVKKLWHAITVSKEAVVGNVHHANFVKQVLKNTWQEEVRLNVFGSKGN